MERAGLYIKVFTTIVVMSLMMYCSIHVLADELGGSMDSAEEIQLETEYSKSFSVSKNKGDDYYYRFTIPNDGVVTIISTRPVDEKGKNHELPSYIFDSTRKSIFSNVADSIICSKTDVYTYKIGLKAGEYWIYLNAYSSPLYQNLSTTFTLSFSPDPFAEKEYNGTEAEATPMELDNTYTGFKCGDDLSDYWKIGLTAETCYLIVIDNADGIKGQNTTLYPENSDDLKYKVGDNMKSYKDDDNIGYYCFTPETTGEYYIEISDLYGELFEYKLTISEFEGKSKQEITGIPSNSITETRESYDSWYGRNPDIILTPSAKTDISFESSDSDVVSVNYKGEVLYRGPGNATITITAEEDMMYQKAELKIEFHLLLKDDDNESIPTYKCSHSVYSLGWYWVPYNETYHQEIHKCKDCGTILESNLEKHNYDYDYDEDGETAVRKATVKRDGLVYKECSLCSHKKYRTIYWKYQGKYCMSYDLKWPNIFPSTKSVKIKLKNPLKGAILKLQIGKKVYKKKIKSNSKTIPMKIKRPSAGEKIKGRLYYKGKIVGKSPDTSKIVYYRHKLKKGMSKKQCRQVPGWEYPYQKSTYGVSETWEYREYDDDGYVTDYSYLYFYRGKLKGWSY